MMGSATNGKAYAKPPARNMRSYVARFCRLSMKELREILRDRRTIVTLVLMPILVYPLLSMAFQKFLLSTMKPTDTIRCLAGVEDPDAIQQLQMDLQRGDQLLKAAHGEDYAQTVPPKPTFEWIMATDLQRGVEQFNIDLGIRLKSEPLRPGANADGRQRFQLELIYRSESPIGEAAVRYFESRLSAVRDADLRSRLQQMGISVDPLLRLERRPIQTTGTGAFSLATLVPLILILMTITGAVYPAIDVTAGERERGTLETLIAAPVSRFYLLMAKYVAVLTVAVLTATVNLVAMTITILSSGLGPVLFGQSGLSLNVAAQVLALSLLFAAFFSAVLLAVTSFARSFKEAQAYLIPLMLVALAPGLLSLMPGLEFQGALAVTPLVNIVLLARDTINGVASGILTTVAILTTALYALAAISIAARIFGTDAILAGSPGRWSDWLRPPDEWRSAPTMTSAMMCLAMMFPCYFLLGNLLARWPGESMVQRLILSSVVTMVLFGGFPLLAARFRRVRLREGFGLRRFSPWSLLAALILGCSLWTFAHEIFLFGRDVGLFSLSSEQFESARRLLGAWREISPLWILVTLALVPAVFEELFFRGYLFNALRQSVTPKYAIVISALLFGLFHVVTSNLLTERFLPSTFLGLVLGWVCYRTGSVFPGMLLHICHNGLLLTIAYYSEVLSRFGWAVGPQAHLPGSWLLAATVAVAVGLALIAKRRVNSER